MPNSSQARVRKATRVWRRLGWWLGSGAGAMILLYHRIAKLQVDPWAQAVTPDHFAEHLEVLRKHAVVMSLSDLVEAMGERRLPRRCVAVTFDDGYADNLYHAKPVLERYDAPATIFLVTDGSGREREFWWDELEQIVWGCPTDAPPWPLTTGGQEYVLQPHAEPIRLYHAIWDRLHPMGSDERREIMEQLQVWSGVCPQARATHRVLATDEITELAKGELIEIGAHTMTHPSLPTLSRESQYQEIAASRVACEALIGWPPAGFAYPYGHATAETADLVREAGFRYAGAVLADVVQSGSDRFMLPRMPIRDWDGDAFERRLLSGFLRR